MELRLWRTTEEIPQIFIEIKLKKSKGSGKKDHFEIYFFLEITFVQKNR